MSSKDKVASSTLSLSSERIGRPMPAVEVDMIQLL